jgi:hypothetical protein
MCMRISMAHVGRRPEPGLSHQPVGKTKTHGRSRPCDVISKRFTPVRSLKARESGWRSWSRPLGGYQ